MIIKKFNDMIFENKHPLEDLFNREYKYIDSVKSNLIDIITREHGISEKYFKGVDFVMELVDEILLSDIIKEDINEFEQDEKRSNYCAEMIYHTLKDKIKEKMEGFKND